MKFNLTLSSSLAAAVVVVAGGAVAGCADSVEPPSHANETTQASRAWPPTPQSGEVVPLDELVEGKTYAEWGAELWRQMYEEPRANNPIEEPSGRFCDERQHPGNVWFLHRNFGGNTERTCEIPQGKYVFAALVDAFEDYPCPAPTFQPSPGQTLYDFLKFGNANAPGTERLLDPFTILQAEMNGRPIPNVHEYRSTSTELVDFTADISWKPIDPCVTGGPQQAVAAGYWLMFRPLDPGEHDLHFRAERPDCQGCFIDATWHITVPGERPRRDGGRDDHDPDRCDDHDHDGTWDTFDAGSQPPRRTY